MRSNLFWIPQSFNDLLKDDCAKLSVQCAGAMAIARLKRSQYFLREAQKKYGVAVLGLAQQWQTGGSAGQDTTFIAILFLCFFEILACYDASCPKAWRAHLYGLGSLFEQRGEEYLRTEFGARIFRQTRSQIIVNALQTKVSVSGVFKSLPDCRSVPTRFGKADEADMLLVRLCEIQARISKPYSKEELRLDASSLEKDLRKWAQSSSPCWTYSEHQNKHQSSHWWDSRCDIYLSTFTMHVWNKVRASRIVLDGIMRGLPPLQAADGSVLY
ncbi:hypothetical protein ONS95_008664 [Cadophora gregata]|uniref:uncharacterized protein n=1 Tax=Cadophora gregata TaxID=51156 RepID=UPI0026DADE04|nr:uncharacterized protein ONS95_008664 [Cadophora gregata]KAK0123652.1 hypothetical protein ONS95_008664 [Cadophora gregata]KAK0129994.1 hypothetical protein ONS96_000532 [Cadophora gregata f. sp. sojae]